jgi:hypothetical protein
MSTCIGTHIPKSTLIAALICLVAAQTATAEVYKCMENGKVVYTDTPCRNAIKKIAIEPPPPAKYGYQAERERARLYLQNHPDIDPVHKAAIEANVVVAGMTEEQVKAAYGEPIEMNLTQTKSGSRWQWVYRKSQRLKFVYLEDGVVIGTN